MSKVGQLLRLIRRTMLLASLVAAIAGCKANHGDESASQVRHDTEAARAQNNRAFQLIQDGKYDEAEKLLKQAIRADVLAMAND